MNKTAGRQSGQEEAGKRLKEIFERLQNQSYPPVHKWEPEFCGDIDIRIAADGTWHYMGTPINRPEMVRLFASVLRRDDDGTYLVTPVEKLKIQVDDAPYIVTSLDINGTGKETVLSFQTQLGDHVIADADHPIWVEGARSNDAVRPYILVRDRLHALIARPVYYELADLAEENTVNGTSHVGVWSRGTFFPLSPAEGGLTW